MKVTNQFLLLPFSSSTIRFKVHSRILCNFAILFQTFKVRIDKNEKVKVLVNINKAMKKFSDDNTTDDAIKVRYFFNFLNSIKVFYSHFKLRILIVIILHDLYQSLFALLFHHQLFHSKEYSKRLCQFSIFSKLK